MYNNNKQTPWVRCVLLLVALMLYSSAYSKINSPYQFLNNKTQTSFDFELVNNLIVIPVQVNDMDLNLILDTGMRSIVVFGKKFTRKLDILEGKNVKLSGYGKKKNRPCKLSINNDILIADVLGSNVGIVVMSSPDLFRSVGLRGIDGIIGYEIFSRFKVRIDYPNQKITLYEPFVLPELASFHSLPLIIKDTKPYIPCDLLATNGEKLSGQYHVDTGSSQDVMVFLKKDSEQQFHSEDRTLVGYGIGGKIKGYKGNTFKMKLTPGFEKEVEPKYIKRGFSNRELQSAHGSIGSGFLKHSVIVLDYINGQFHLKNNKV